MSLLNTFASKLHSVIEQAEIDGREWSPMSRLLLIGNGGSMAIAQHIANDLIKAGCRASTPDVVSLSCLANDFGWEMALEKWILGNAWNIDQMVAISSSGRSQNIINACKYFTTDRTEIVTLTGFDADNPIRKLGHTNYWVPSNNYGIVECAHLAILHSIVNPGVL